MPNGTVSELGRAGIPFDGYRELGRAPVEQAQAAGRWPLLALVDQILVAERWKRESIALVRERPSNVTPLAPRSAPAPTSDWFHGAAHADKSGA
jgi:hypothetical protein